MQTDAVRRYYEPLRRKWASLLLKRGFDAVVSLVGLIVLSPVLAALAVWIKAVPKARPVPADADYALRKAFPHL